MLRANDPEQYDVVSDRGRSNVKIIVEGPDGGGKTTLLRRLGGDLGFHVEPRVVSKEAQALTNLRRWVDKDLEVHKTPKLYDRHRLISEPIYGPALRNEMDPEFQDLQWLTSVLHRFWACEPIVIYCLPPFQVVLRNVMADRENLVVREKIHLIYSLYFIQAAQRGTNRWVWDFTAAEDNTKMYEMMLNGIRQELKYAR
jgi:hypothetical protein